MDDLPTGAMPVNFQLPNQAMNMSDDLPTGAVLVEGPEATVAKYKALQAKYGTPSQTLLAGAEGIARGLTLGMSDVLRTKIPPSSLPEALRTTPEAVAGRMEANPITNALSPMVGGAGLIGLTGGVGALVPAATMEASALARLGAMTAEGGIFGAGNAVTDYALGDPDLNAQKVMSHVGMGSLLGLGFGGLGEMFRLAKPVTAKIFDKITKPKTAQQDVVADVIAPSVSQAGQEGQTFEKILDINPEVEFKIKEQKVVPDTLQGINQLLEEAKVKGYTEELPSYEVLRAAVDETPTTIPILEAQVNAHQSQAKYNEHKQYRITQTALQDLETVQKKGLNDDLDGFINNVAPSGKATGNSLENGEQAAKIFNNLLDVEQKASGAMVGEARSWKTEGYDHLEGVLGKMSEVVPGIGDAIATNAEGKIILKPYSSEMGITRETYKKLREAFRALEKNPQDFDKLFNIRDNLGAIEKMADEKTKNQIMDLKKSMMDYMGNMAEAGPEGLREGFRRYAINEESRQTIQRSFGIDTKEIAPHKVGKGEENITAKIFKDTGTVIAAKNILPKQDFDQILANYIAQVREKFTDNGVFSSNRFGKFLKDKEQVLSVAFEGNEKALKDITNITNISRMIPDAASKNPSGTADTLWQMIKKARSVGDVSSIFQHIIETKWQKNIQTQNFENYLQGRAQNASAMTKIKEVLDSTAKKMEAGAKAVYSLTPAIATAEDKLSGYEKHAKKIKELASDGNALMNNSMSMAEPMNKVAPNISQSLQKSYMTGINFLATKLPKPARDMPLGQEYVPSNAEKEKFNQYFRAVNDPMIAFKQMKTGTLSNETMEALQAVHPSLLEDMRASILSNMDLPKAKKLPYKVKISLSKFLNMPLDNALIPSVMQSNQATFAVPQQQPAQGSVKPTVGGMKELNLSGMTQTKTYRDMSGK